MAKSVLKWNEFGPTDARSYQAITDHLPGGRSQFIIQKVFKTYALRDFGITASRWVNHGSFKTPASAKKYARELLENYPVMKANPAPKRKTAARTQRAAVGYVNRPSQITKKAPSKRLKKRRTVNLQSPRGVFPNPKKRDPTYWVIVLHDGYLSYRSDSGYTGSQPFDTMEGNTPRQKALSFIKQLGIKRGQYEILKQNPDSVHFDIDVNSHNARGAKAKTRVNPSARKKQIVVEYELSGQNFAKRNRGMYGWKELATFPDTPEGSENAIQYAQAYHNIAPHLRIQVVTK